eukprot:2741270-Rhodomonas_salina.5
MRRGVLRSRMARTGAAAVALCRGCPEHTWSDPGAKSNTNTHNLRTVCTRIALDCAVCMRARVHARAQESVASCARNVTAVGASW